MRTTGNDGVRSQHPISRLIIRSQSHEAAKYIESIFMKFDRRLDSSAAAASFEYQSDHTIMITDIAVANSWYKAIYMILLAMNKHMAYIV